MLAATADRTEFAPPQPPGQWRALGLAALAHVLLLGALTWGVNWKHQSDTPLSVEAELWSAVPRQAAPRLVPPPPPPKPLPLPPKPVPVPPPVAAPLVRDAEIALARQKKEADKKEAEKKEAEKKEAQKKEALRKEAEKKEAQEKQRLAREAQRQEAQKIEAQKKDEAARAEKELKAQREENLRRMMTGLANATGSKTSVGTAVQSAGPSASYAGKVAARVKPNIVFTDDVAGNPAAEVDVHAAPDGTILSRKLVKPSGVKAWDDAVLKAIDKTEKLPIDTDGRVPSALTIRFRPKD